MGVASGGRGGLSNLSVSKEGVASGGGPSPPIAIGSSKEGADIGELVMLT